MIRNYRRRVKFSTSPHASSPTLPLPRVPSGSFLLRSVCPPRSLEAISDSLRGGQLWLGLGSPAESSGWPQKRKPPPRRGYQGGEGATGGKAPGEGPAHPGRGLSHRVLGFPRPSRRRLRTLSGCCARSARLNPPPGCCIANKILMSPLPLPLGRLLRSARGAGSSASRAGRGSPVRSWPCRRGLSAPPAAAQAPPALSRQTVVSLPPGFQPRLRDSGEAGPRDQRVGPCAPLPSRTGAVGAALLPRPRGSPSGTQLASFLPPGSLLPRSLSGHRRGSPSHCPQFIASPLPRAWPSAWVFPNFFITYFDPASLCPRFLRKFYCPRSRVFD